MKYGNRIHNAGISAGQEQKLMIEPKCSITSEMVTPDHWCIIISFVNQFSYASICPTAIGEVLHFTGQ